MHPAAAWLLQGTATHYRETGDAGPADDSLIRRHAPESLPKRRASCV